MSRSRRSNRGPLVGDSPSPGEIHALPPTLAALIAAPKRLSARRLWRALEDGEKASALKEHILQRKARDALVQSVAEARNFRTKTVRGWNDNKIVEWTLRVTPDNPLARELLHTLHVARRREMLAQFLDSLDIPNDDGIRPTGPEDERPGSGPAEADVHSAADDLAREHGLRRVVVYFLTAAILEEPYTAHLISWLTALSPDAAPPDVASSDAESAPALDDEVEEEEGDPARHRSFTTLDRLLIEAMVDARQDVVGSLEEDEVDDAVDEFVSLNRSRQHSYFHVGLRDVLFKGGASAELPAPSEERVRWYWAGSIMGWVRSESSADIVAAYEAHASVRSLGDGADFATRAAAPHVVHALARERRGGEVAGFVQVRALLRFPQLFRTMLEVGTNSLRRGEESDARAIFDRLMEAVRALEDEGHPPAFRPFLTVRRRRAHCLQRALEHDRARRGLEELLDLDFDPNHRAMVHADLGLLAGRFNRLEDVSLPTSRDGLQDFADRLSEGIEHFERSVEGGHDYTAHGHYCLGVLGMAQRALDRHRGGFGEVENHLLRAWSRFGGRARSYGQDLVDRTALYLGIARAARAHSAGDLSHAASLMVNALDAGAAFPPYLIDPVVDGLDLGAPEDLSRFAEALLKASGSEALDVLARSATAINQCREVTDALRGRAKERGATAAAAVDLRACLRGYLETGCYDDAEDVLDRLETLAVREIGTAEFETLLSDDASYQPAWEPTDAKVARARCLESRGDITGVFGLLGPLVHQYVTENDVHSAAGLLGYLRSIGLPDDHLIDLTRRVDARRSALVGGSRADSPSQLRQAPPSKVRVLFVGGDERQKKSSGTVKDAVASRSVNVQVTFIHPGWSGNWSPWLEKTKAELERHDAVVLMRFMRTQLGRQIRKRCDGKPWRFCWGAGRRTMTDAILEAADAARGLD